MTRRAGDAGHTGDAAVASALRTQLALLEELEALSLRQGPLIEDEEPGPLLELLALRGELVERLREGEGTLPDGPEAWERLRLRLSGDQREVIDVLLGECAKVSGRIASRDEADRRRLAARLDDVGAQIGGLAKSRAASGAYGARNESPRFQDREA